MLFVQIGLDYIGSDCTVSCIVSVVAHAVVFFQALANTGRPWQVVQHVFTILSDDEEEEDAPSQPDQTENTASDDTDEAVEYVEVEEGAVVAKPHQPQQTQRKRAR